MQQVQIFNASEATGINREIRVLNRDGQPWFAAQDVADAVGFKLVSQNGHPISVKNFLSRLDEDEKELIWKRDGYGEFFKEAVGAYRTYIVSESGLYKLLMRSSSPRAKPFQDWLSRTVIPSIRKDGAYVQGEEKVATGEIGEEEFILKAMTLLQGKVERLKEENQRLSKVANTFTISQFAFEQGVYFSHGQKIRLSAILRRLMNEAGLDREQVDMLVTKPNGDQVETKVYQYPRWALEQAVKSL